MNGIAAELRRGRGYDELVKEYRIAVLAEAMQQTNYHQGRAAELLRIHVRTLQYHIRGLQREFGIKEVK